MNSWRIILATMVIFGAGVVTGGLLVGLRDDRLAASVRPFGPLRPPLQGSPIGTRLELLRRMGRELDLTAQQQDEVDKVLQESQERMRKDVAPLLREEMARTVKEFRHVLTPEQRPRFDELLRQRQQQQRERAAGRTNAPAALTNN